MDKKRIIKEVKKYLEKNFQGEATGHDYFHFSRVAKMAKEITKKEGGDLFVIELSALLHDIADWKFHNGKTTESSKKVKILLKEFKVDQGIIEKVCHIVDNVSFKGAGEKNSIRGKEGMIVQDADRLDAVGAIAIARLFAYGGYEGREMYNPKIKPQTHKSFKDYKNKQSTSVNHFYEKLLLLKDRMNTKTAKKIAKERHEFMEKYLKQFYKEWEVNI